MPRSFSFSLHLSWSFSLTFILIMAVFRKVPALFSPSGSTCWLLAMFGCYLQKVLLHMCCSNKYTLSCVAKHSHTWIPSTGRYTNIQVCACDCPLRSYVQCLSFIHTHAQLGVLYLAGRSKQSVSALVQIKCVI